ncbi:MAG: phosphocholine cytidylyltransferase family protein [Candidatus Lokiarchaeota archaeon]|nr:phosphocholine cytidylyltransferase family protein [Candidatus Lokiarchaeota archaeon]
MKVIILNAGIGKRLGHLTQNSPKCLVKVTNEKTILDVQLENLIKCGLEKFIMLTGPFEDMIRRHIDLNYPSISVDYIQNPKYSQTNYIYSLYLTKNQINDEVLLMHGDLIFSDTILNQIIENDEKDCVLVNKEMPVPQKDFKARLVDDRIIKIGVNEFGEDCAFLAPLYKLSKPFYEEWFKEIEKYVKNGQVSCYAEDALNDILDKLDLRANYINDKKCMEIDDFEDLELARSYLEEELK